MLTPDYLDALPQPLVALMEQVEEDILQDVARRIGKLGLYDPLTEGAEWQLWRYEQIRALRSEVVKRLAKASGKTEEIGERMCASCCSRPGWTRWPATMMPIVPWALTRRASALPPRCSIC